MATGVQRFSNIIDAYTDPAVRTNQQKQNIADALFWLTSATPDFTQTNEQRAQILCQFLRDHMRGLLRAGIESRERANTQANIQAAVSTGLGDL